MPKTRAVSETSSGDYSRIDLMKEPGQPARVRVFFPTDQGEARAEFLLPDAVTAGAITVAERTALVDVLTKLFAYGETVAGFTGT